MTGLITTNDYFLGINSSIFLTNGEKFPASVFRKYSRQASNSRAIC